MHQDKYPPQLAAALDRSSLPSIDGLRTVAVFLVVFYHLGFRVNGGLGVLLFFVISGFLITWLLLKEESRWGGVSLRLFYLRRTLRIFPAFYAYWILVVVGFSVLGKPVDKGQAIASLLYVNNYYQAFVGDPDTMLSHTWSLGIEEQFYLLWPALFIALGWRHKRIQGLIAAIGFIWIYRLVMVLVFRIHQGYVYEAWDMRADHLFIGCLLAAVLYSGSASRLIRVLTTKPAMIFLTVLLLAVSSVMPRLVTWRYRDLVGFIVDPVLTAVLIAQGLAFWNSSGVWLNWGWMRWLGRLSYSIYLYQQIALGPAKKLFSHRPVVVQAAAAIACCVAVSALSFYMIEKPFLSLKDRIGQRKNAAPKITPAAPTTA
jgi:peptidoglycan/LPS O-acetylase OafA/YrhL